jgi:14-3-3 protein epsilon
MHNQLVKGKEDIIFLISLCDKAGRFDDMFDYFAEYMDKGNEVSERERQLYSICIKESIGTRRNAWRSLKYLNSHKSVEPKGQADYPLSLERSLVAAIKTRIEIAIAQLTKNILPTCLAAQQRVFFLKLRGDLERYNAEVTSGDEHEHWSYLAHSTYREAGDVAMCRLKPSDPVRLSLMLNLSVFYYEILNSPERACIVSKAACDDAIDVGLLSDQKKPEDENEQKEAIELFNSITANLRRWCSHLYPQTL